MRRLIITIIFLYAWPISLFSIDRGSAKDQPREIVVQESEIVVALDGDDKFKRNYEVSARDALERKCLQHHPLPRPALPADDIAFPNPDPGDDLLLVAKMFVYPATYSYQDALAAAARMYEFSPASAFASRIRCLPAVVQARAWQHFEQQDNLVRGRITHKEAIVLADLYRKRFVDQDWLADQPK